MRRYRRPREPKVTRLLFSSWTTCLPHACLHVARWCTLYSLLFTQGGGVWVLQRDGSMFVIGEESIAPLLILCQR